MSKPYTGKTLGVIGLAAIFIIVLAIYFVLSQDKNNEPVVRKNTISMGESARIIDYNRGIKITKPSDVEGLKGASPSFKKFILNDLEIYKKDLKIPGCTVEISVMKIYNDEFALGSVKQCDSESDHIWKKENNNWSKVLAGTINSPKWSCSGVELYRIPSALVPECME